MRVLAACSLGGASHLRPLLPFLAAARRHGHEVVVVAPPGLADMVAEAGHPFVPGGEPPEEDVRRIRELLPVAAPEVASALANGELFGRMATRAMLGDMGRVMASFRPDLVLREPCEYASAVVAADRGVAHAQVAVSLAAVEAGSIVAATPVLEDRRGGLARSLWSSPYLTRFPATVDPSPFAATVRVREPGPTDVEPLPAWWPPGPSPLVYMTFGTVLGYLSIAGAVYRRALEVAACLDARVLLSVGRRFDASSLGPIPSNVHVEAWVDQVRVLAQADLCLCHGGSGTVFDALAAGVPLVVTPLFADQSANGRLVDRAGAGRTVDAGRGHRSEERRTFTVPEASRLVRELEVVMAEDSYRRRARVLAGEMAAQPTVDEVLARLLSGRDAASDVDR